MNRLSLRLSLIRAWLRLASPLMTLMKSNTTRRSQPMIRSRLRKPTSKSMTTVLWPRKARPAAKAAAVVVLPTPPLPDVMTTTFAKGPPSPAPRPLSDAGIVRRRNPDSQPLYIARGRALTPRDGQPVVDQGNLHCGALLLGRQLFADKIAPRD